MIAIIAAMPAELAGITRQRVPAQGWTTRPDGMIVAVSGIGRQPATTMAHCLVDKGADALVSWGCAAALSPALRPGDLLLPRFIAAPGLPSIPVTPGWRQHLLAQLPARMRRETGDLVSNLPLLVSNQVKREIFEQTEAVAADMESYALAEVAFTGGIPFLAIRTVADTARTGIPACIARQLANEPAAGRFGVSTTPLLHPGCWPALVRLAWQFNAARRTLAWLAGHCDLDPGSARLYKET